MSETKQLFRVLAVFIPFPFFWALFEQQGSRWIIQAQRMNGQLVSKTVKQIKRIIDMIRYSVLALAPAGIGLRIKTLIHEVSCLQGNSITIKPDQMQVFNPLLILCLIPVFETVVYPLMKRVGLPTG